jgi:hypothetical protein
MTTAISFRLSMAAFVVLALPVLTSVGRCAGQENRREVDRPSVLQQAVEAQRTADQKATARVLHGCVRTALLLPFDPDEAFQHLKSVHEATRNDPDVSAVCRERLESQLEWALWGVLESGSIIKRLQNEWLATKAEFRANLEGWQFQLERWKVHLRLLLGTE